MTPPGPDAATLSRALELSRRRTSSAGPGRQIHGGLDEPVIRMYALGHSLVRLLTLVALLACCVALTGLLARSLTLSQASGIMGLFDVPSFMRVLKCNHNYLS